MSECIAVSLIIAAFGVWGASSQKSITSVAAMLVGTVAAVLITWYMVDHTNAKHRAEREMQIARSWR